MTDPPGCSPPQTLWPCLHFQHVQWHASAAQRIAIKFFERATCAAHSSASLPSVSFSHIVATSQRNRARQRLGQPAAARWLAAGALRALAELPRAAAELATSRGPPETARALLRHIHRLPAHRLALASPGGRRARQPGARAAAAGPRGGPTRGGAWRSGKASAPRGGGAGGPGGPPSREAWHPGHRLIKFCLTFESTAAA